MARWQARAHTQGLAAAPWRHCTAAHARRGGQVLGPVWPHCCAPTLFAARLRHEEPGRPAAAKQGCSGNWAQDPSHPKREPCHYINQPIAQPQWRPVERQPCGQMLGAPPTNMTGRLWPTMANHRGARPTRQRLRPQTRAGPRQGQRHPSGPKRGASRFQRDPCSVPPRAWSRPGPRKAEDPAHAPRWRATAEKRTQRFICHGGGRACKTRRPHAGYTSGCRRLIAVASRMPRAWVATLAKLAPAGPDPPRESRADADPRA